MTWFFPVNRQFAFNGGGAVVEVLGSFHVANLDAVWQHNLDAYIVDGCVAYPLWDKLHAIVAGVGGVVVNHAGDVGGYGVPDALSSVKLLIKSTEATSSVTVVFEVGFRIGQRLDRW